MPAPLVAAAGRKAAAKVARQAMRRAAAKRRDSDGGGWKGIGLAALAALVAIWFVLSSVISGMTGVLGGAAAQAADTDCGAETGESIGQVATGPTDVNEAKKRNIIAIITAAKERGLGDREMTLGIMVATVETNLLNLAAKGNGQDESQKFPNDGISPADHQSVGLFQQQPWWGTMKQRMTPVESAGLFYDAMLKQPSWESGPLGALAQKIQASAFPDRYAVVEGASRLLVVEYVDEVKVSKKTTPSPSGGEADIEQAGTSGTADQCGSQSFDAMECDPRPDLPASLADGMTPDGLRVLWCGAEHAPKVKTIGTIGDRPRSTGDDHATGKAVDFMIEDWRGSGGGVGDELAKWMMDNADSMGVKYVIWDAKIWSKDRDGKPLALSKWRPYRDPTGANTDTTMHRDHVHVSVYGDAATASVEVNGDWALPLKGNYTLISEFGQRWGRLHAGVDMALPEGNPVMAAHGGTVSNREDPAGYGHYVVINSEGGQQTLYGHLSKQSMPDGAKVKPGQMIGYSGNTGGSQGPHLHFEVRKDAGNGAGLGTPFDPVPHMVDAGVPLQCAPNVIITMELSKTAKC